ncbi:acyl carrier protein [Croceicoccus gelatinilyticus]|uniref:acyl carrier protein n=1 Tax=Croceicoccus gelatinilyticus TaxID=2835536 RepID=UPI001BD00C4E|nr:acyl carrier protein [Croceicoccus gelatinilyticus]MBS7671363.1 acyl carrier protein [Croceicoccus gelatinilyticus]
MQSVEEMVLSELETLGCPVAVRDLDTAINDLPIDSLDQINLVAAFEDEYDILISNADTSNCGTIRDLVTLVEQRIAARQPKAA